jgi:hypothetical protein
MIHHLVQAAMLEIDALIRHDPIRSTFQLAGHGDVGRICAVIVDAGITLGIYPDAEVGLPRTGDEDAQVGSKQDIGVFAYDVIGFDGAAIERHHERAAGGVVDGAVLGQMDAAGGAQAEGATSLQGDLDGLFSGGNLAAIAQYRFPVGDVDRAGDLYLSSGGSPDRLLGI